MELSLKSLNVKIQSIFLPFLTYLMPHSTPNFHSDVEMYWNLIIPSSYDSLLCWLVWWLLWCVMLSQCSEDTKRSGVDAWFFFLFLLLKFFAFRWTTSCFKMCAMRRQWPLWRTPLTWFTSRWPSRGLSISMTCTPLQTTPAVRIYLFLFYSSLWRRSCSLMFLFHYEQPNMEQGI